MTCTVEVMKEVLANVVSLFVPETVSLPGE